MFWRPGLWTLVVFFCVALPSEATTSKRGFEEPRFFIESIRVEGAQRTSTDLIVSETLLVGDQEYSESELLDAVYRIQRLPFIFDARFALDRGSERGKLELVISVQEVSRFFFGGDSTTTAFARGLFLDRSSFADSSQSNIDLVGGMRFFMGKYGVFFAAVSTNESVQLGLTRYQLFGRRVFASLGLVQQGCCPTTVRPLGLDPTFSSWTSDTDSTRGNVTLGIPLRGNQSLRFDASRLQSQRGSRRLVLDPFASGTLSVHRDLVDQRIELAWLVDSTDDPNFPSRGRSLSVAYELREIRADFPVAEGLVVVNPNGIEEPVVRDGLVTLRSQLHRLSVVGSQHWSVSRRNTLSASGRLSFGRSDVEQVPLDGPRVLSVENLDIFEANLSLRHALRIWQSRRDQTYRELRWENVAEVGYETTAPDFDLVNNPLDRWSVQTGLVFRSHWGVFRVVLSVEDVGRSQ